MPALEIDGMWLIHSLGSCLKLKIDKNGNANTMRKYAVEQFRIIPESTVSSYKKNLDQFHGKKNQDPELDRRKTN